MKHLQHIFLIVLLALTWSTRAWGNETIIKEQSFNNVVSGNSLSWGGSHVTFKLSGNGLSYYGTYKALQLSWDTSYKLSWTVNNGCTINVTNVSMDVRTSMEGYITFNGVKSKNIYGTSTTNIQTGSISKGNSDNIPIVTSNNKGFLGAKPNFFVYKITINYTITPNAPVASPTTATVSVTLDTNNPSVIDLSSYFSSTALNSDSHFGSLIYNSNGGTISGNTFYSTSAGSYNVYAYLSGVNNCHAQSSNSNNLIITVNRLTGSIVAKTEDFSMYVNNTMDLSSCISSSLGTGAISYEVISSNNSSAIINDHSFTPSASGTYTIKATKAQDSQYMASNTTFDIVVNKIANTLTVLGNQDLKVDENLTGVYSNKNSNATLQYSITDVVYTNEAQNNGTGVISFNPSENKITALNAGSAKLTIYQEANGVYEAVEKSLTINVSKYDQTLSWDNTISDLTLTIGQTLTNNTAQATSNLPVRYESNNTDAITVNESTGVLSANEEGTATITVSQSGDYKYNAATSITRVFTVAAKKQATFTPAWGESESADIKVGTTTTIALTNVATDATFSVSANPTGIISWSRSDNTLTISGDVAGTTTLTLTQEERTLVYGNTANYSISVSRYANTFAVAAESKAMKVGEAWDNVVTAAGNENTVVSYSTADVATYDATNNRITAVGEGTTDITFTQAATADHDGVTKTIAVTVTKVTNTLSISLPTQEVSVDGTIDLGITGHNNAAAIVATITDTQLSSSVNNGSDVITFDATNNRIVAHNAGTAKVTFSQPTTTQYTAYTSETYEITVNKISNSITVTLNGEQKNSMNIARGQQVTIAYSSVSNGAYQTNLTTGSNATATIDGNSITAGNTDGTNIWTITQDETFKFAPATTTVRIKVNSVAEEEGYVLNDPSEYYQGTGEGVAHTYELSGPGETLTYTAWTWLAAIYYHLYVQYSVNGKDWETAEDNQSLSTSEQHFSCTVPENAKYIRFYFPAGGTSRKLIKDVKVTRKTYVRTSTTTTDLGEMYTDESASTTFNISYSSTNGGDIEITSNNPRFTVDKTSVAVANNSDNVNSAVAVKVTYTPDPDHLGSDEGTIIVGDRYYTQELSFTASAKKYPTTITRGSNPATSTTVDGSIDNAFAFSGTTTAVPSASSDDDFYYSISHTQTSAVNNGDGVISYNPATNTVTGLNAGTARLTIYQKNTNLYNATSQTFDFTVTKLANNTSFALTATALDVDGTATVQLTNDDSDGALSASYSNVTYDNEAQNREGGLLSFVDGILTGVNAGTATVTITQAETYKYESKSATFDVTVSKLSQTLTWDNPTLETSMQVGSTLTGNTATSDAGLTPVTYSSGNTAAITVDANTGVLTAVATGSNINITASQAGNYKYLPATLSRQFSVFNKQTPAFTTDSHFTGFDGRIEFLGTATITVTGVSSGEDFTITNGNETIIRVERDGETITITALSVGSTTLTLAQAGNEDFIAKSQTYNIEVYMPEGYLALSPTVAPTHEAGTYTKIFLNRTFRVGYNTLVLPFDTDVDELVGSAYDSDEHYWVAQLSAVTLNTQDGYTLYFQKVPNGAISANQPYVLYLGTQVMNPIWVGSFSVSAASAGQHAATTGYSGYADWVMHANYVPGMDMEGKYGIVNANAAMQRGGSGSTLNAFTAYITAPAVGGNVKLRSAFLDEDGEMTLVEGLPFEDGNFDDEEALSGLSRNNDDAGVYGLDGRRRQGMGKGLNIVRMPDGSTRKVLK